MQAVVLSGFVINGSPMKLFRAALVALCVVAVGAMIVAMLSQAVREHDAAVASSFRPEPHELPDLNSHTDVLSAEPVERVEAATPPGAITDERVLYFEGRSDYLAYVDALLQAGHAPMGVVDELHVVRVSLDALHALDPRHFGAGVDFSYTVERPAPPEVLPPQVAGELRAYGESARQICGGIVDGDGSGVLVGVLDSGIVTHAQFNDVGITYIDLIGDGAAATGAGHGTSVASIISGSEGVASAAELLVVRVLDDEGNGNSFHAAEGIVQAVDLGARVINMSFGLYYDSALVRNAVRYADEHGVILVAAAGNDGYGQLPYPAAYSEVLAVTAVDAAGRHARFPNQSEEIDFAAPGLGVMAAGEDGGLVQFSGTSASAPFVSGTLASMISAQPERSAADTIALLQRYLNDAGAPGVDPRYGRGLVDWDRLRERGAAGLVDLAIADIYLSREAQPGTTMPIEVIVQNRGTVWLHTAQLDVTVGALEPIHFTLGSLGPGQVTSRKVYAQLPSLDTGEMLQVSARLLPTELADDVRQENNLKAVRFRQSGQQ